MRPERVALAVIATLLALPCMGWGVFSMLAAAELPATATRWRLMCGTVELGILAGLFLLWRWALVRRDPKACERCGYDLTGTRGGPCPECGSRPEFQNSTAKRD